MLFLERVLYLITKNRISKNKLLNDLNLGKNSFVNWGERDTIPSGEVVVKIADYFNVTTDYLLGKEEKPTPKEQALPAPVQRLLEAANDLTSEELENLVATAEILSKKHKK